MEENKGKRKTKPKPKPKKTIKLPNGMYSTNINDDISENQLIEHLMIILIIRKFIWKIKIMDWKKT